MYALAEQRIFCFEKMVLKLGMLFLAMAVFSGQNMSISAYTSDVLLKGYILKEHGSNALFLLKEKWTQEIEEKYGQTNIKTIDEGIIYTRLNKKINGRNIKINVAEINRNLNPNLEIIPKTAANEIHTKSAINKIEPNALLAVNGTYFKQNTGTPLGTLVINNEIITGPIYERVAMGIGDNQFKTARLGFSGELKNKTKTLKIDNINQPRMLYSHVLIYTNKWGEKTPVTKSKCKQLAIQNGKIIATSDYPLIIPENGIVISAPKEKLEGFKLGEKVEITYKITPEWKDIKHIISGGPYLMKDGEIFIDAQSQKLTSISGRNPRTAIGYTKDNTMIIVTVDGRKEGSSGVTLNELANLMKELGCYEAINLDGGSSTVMFVNGTILNGTNAANTIKISNALIIKEKS